MKGSTHEYPLAETRLAYLRPFSDGRDGDARVIPLWPTLLLLPLLFLSVAVLGYPL